MSGGKFMGKTFFTEDINQLFVTHGNKMKEAVTWNIRLNIETHLLVLRIIQKFKS